MARRSSARLRNRNSSTPKRVSLSHDALQTPRTAPVKFKLSALEENDEMPGSFPRSESPPSPATVPKGAASYVSREAATPKRTTPIKPSEEEMHPQQHQQSTAKPLEEARWLGFSKMAPNTAPPKQTSKIATLQGTPTRAPRGSAGVNSPKFQFTFRREQSLELSPEAKKLMNEKREEAAKIREEMEASGVEHESINDAVARKIATPKGKKGRFSDMHMEQFKKMDSIAGHASALRGDANRPKAATVVQTEGQKAQQTAQSPTKSLKRSPSKAGLDEPDRPPRLIQRSPSKPSLWARPATQLPRTKSSNNLTAHEAEEESSPTKRAKRSQDQDVSIARSSSSENRSAMPGTPSKTISYPDLSTVASPTQASLARAASVKSEKASRIPGPTLLGTPSKAISLGTTVRSPKTSTALLARSPSKVSLFSNPVQGTVEKQKETTSPLLLRSPTKVSPFKKQATNSNDSSEAKKSAEPQLLTRSPLKMSVAKTNDSEVVQQKAASSIPFLSRSPAKIALPKAESDMDAPSTPGKSSSANIIGRFNLLRSSPVKSILRSPQRLYSDDPAKVAAGTHLASPNLPKSKNKPLPALPAEATFPEKHVDFTSSTKARYERAQSELSSTPSKEPTPPSKSANQPNSLPKPIFAQYPSLPSDETNAVLTPQKRRQTAVPGDFTFTANGHGIVFGQSPNAPVSAGKSNRPSTIRHVSAEPQVSLPPASAAGSKKRKFEFENEKIVDEEMTGATSDKENDVVEADEERPAKRMKPTAPEPSPAKATSRPKTLGVKPKKGAKNEKDKKPNTISRARLNALSQPKRRT